MPANVGRVVVSVALFAFVGAISPASAPSAVAQTDCEPSYPSFCIPNYGYDALNCADVAATDFPVLAPDVNGFDGDYDGIGFES